MTRLAKGTQLLTIQQVARRIAFSVHTIRKWVKYKLAAFPEPLRVGPNRQWRWREIDIELWLDRQERKPAAKRYRGALKESRP